MIHFAKHQPELSSPVALVHMTKCLGLLTSTANQFGTLKGRSGYLLCSLAVPKRKTNTLGPCYLESLQPCM